MKKKTLLFGLLTLSLFIFFISCEKDDETLQAQQHSSHLKTTKVSFDQVLNELSDNNIKQKVNLNKTLFQSYSIDNSILRTNSNFSNYFIKNQKEDILITYILNINSYTQNTPYFLKLIITKNKNETERMGYLKYIPSNSTTSLDLSTFTGEVQILDSEFEITATSIYINGLKQETSQNNNSSNRIICTDEILITEVKCSHSGTHGVGESCQNGLINDAHYEISIFTRCNSDRTNPVQIIEDTGSTASGTTSFSNTAYLLPFLNSLTTEEISIYLDNPSIQEYLVQNLIVAPIPNCDPMLGGDCTQVIIEPQAEQFINQLLDIAYQNEATFEIKQNIDTNNSLNYNTVQDFEDFLNGIPNDGFDFETEDDLQTNQKTAKLKLALTGAFGGVNFNIKQNLIPTYSIANVTSSAYGFTVAFGWEQDDYNVSINTTSNTATIIITGDIHYNVFVDGIGTLWTSEIEIKVVLNTLTGNIISAVKI